ncbi:MAG TPA: hypothetical protein PKY63_08565 [Bacteroidales bacterium]|nr:hypothetical protein [Bacteroidales bacterium]
MVKTIPAILSTILLLSCNFSNPENNANHYAFRDIKTCFFYNYLLEKNPANLPYFENQIIQELSKCINQKILFEELIQDSTCWLVLECIDFNTSPAGIRQPGFEIFLDSCGSMSHNCKSTCPEELADKYISYLDWRSQNFRRIRLTDIADKEMIISPEMGRVFKSRGFLEMGIETNPENSAQIKQIRNIRTFIREVASKYYDFRDETAYKYFSKSLKDLSKTEWIKTVKLSEFYSEFHFFTSDPDSLNLFLIPCDHKKLIQIPNREHGIID